MAIPVHVTRRGEVYHYVRRIPDELQPVFGCSRIQKSLRTRDRSRALSQAARLNDEIERQLDAARGKLDVALELVDLSGWTAGHWRDVARWFEAKLIQDDLVRRLPKMTGAALRGQQSASQTSWSDRTHFRAQIDLFEQLQRFSVSEYLRERLGEVNRHIRQLGVCMLPASQHGLLFASDCLKAELTALDVFFRRDRGEIVDWIDPYSIDGPWRGVGMLPAVTVPALNTVDAPSTSSLSEGHIGKTLTDCQEQWKRDREAAKRTIREAHLREMSNTIALFETTQGVRDIGLITRKAVIGFRSYLQNSGKFEIATINKKVGFITTLLAAELARFV